VGRFQKDRPGVLPHPGLLPAHHPSYGHRSPPVGDYQVLRPELPLLAVEAQNPLPGPGQAHLHPAPESSQVEGMEGLAELQKDVVGHVHEIGDGPDPRRLETQLHPVRGGTPPHSLHHQPHVPGREAGMGDGHPRHPLLPQKPLLHRGHPEPAGLRG
jgi:hypothetical protein